MHQLDRDIVALLQDGVEICERPFRGPAAELGVSEEELLARIERLLAEGVLSRFGPLYNAEEMGGAFTLAAMSVPREDFERVAAQVNAHPEVAHNYEREHALNMWFVVATESAGEIARVIERIEVETGLPVLELPKLEEYFVGLRLEAR